MNTFFNDPTEKGRNEIDMMSLHEREIFNFQKSLEGRKNWISPEEIPAEENPYEDFENEVISFSKKEEETSNIFSEPTIVFLEKKKRLLVKKEKILENSIQ